MTPVMITPECAKTTRFVIEKLLTMEAYGKAKSLPIFIPEFTRDDLTRLFAELGFQTGAEIGVEWGRFSESICRNNPGLRRLFCIDPWKQYELYQTPQETVDNYYAQAQKMLEPYPCWFIRTTSIEAVKLFKDETLDFVYIDGAHDYDNVLHDLAEWSNKVRSGGIVAGHDYKKYKSTNAYSSAWGVIEAVNDYTFVEGINPWFIFGTKESEGPDGPYYKCPKSFMWVKP